MISDEQKIKEVEESLDGIKSCFSEQCSGFSGRRFRGNFTRRIFRACNNHLERFLDNNAFDEVVDE